MAQDSGDQVVLKCSRVSPLGFCSLCDLWGFECHITSGVPSVSVASGFLRVCLVFGILGTACPPVKRKSSDKAVIWDMEPRGGGMQLGLLGEGFMEC